MRTNKIREQRNKAARSRLRTAIKNARQTEGEGSEAAFLQAQSLLDRAARKRLIHPNKAARLKSQLARVVKESGASA
jgi:small subunit ribosomal protein S20